MKYKWFILSSKGKLRSIPRKWHEGKFNYVDLDGAFASVQEAEDTLASWRLMFKDLGPLVLVSINDD